LQRRNPLLPLGFPFFIVGLRHKRLKILNCAGNVSGQGARQAAKAPFVAIR
jgi:hypothetical protein